MTVKIFCGISGGSFLGLGEAVPLAGIALFCVSSGWFLKQEKLNRANEPAILADIPDFMLNFAG